MSNAVDVAQRWAKWMINKETRGPGDRDNAMRRLSRRYSISYGTLWGLLYRVPKDMRVSVFEKLGNAYEAELRRQHRLLEQERAVTDAKGWVGEALCSASAALTGSGDWLNEEKGDFDG